MKKENWVWMPHAGHFILGNRCRFHLATYVGKYLVSTVGELWNIRAVREITAETYDPVWFGQNKDLKDADFDRAYFKRFGYDNIGLDRKYETMVFKAKKSTCKCCPYEMASGIEIDMEGYNTPEEAYNGHLKMCNKWAKQKEGR